MIAKAGQRRRLVKLALAVVGLATIAVLGPASKHRVDAQSPTPKPAPTGPPRAAPPSDDPHHVLPARLDADLRARAANVYAGQARGTDGAIEVLVTRDDASVQSIVRAAVADVRRAQPAGRTLPQVRVVSGKANTLAELERIRDQVTARRATLEALGIKVYQWGVDERSNRVEVGIQTVTPEARAILEREFGAGTIEVFQSGRPVLLSRSEDVSPVVSAP